MIDPLLLATLVASRVCHDLSAAISSVTTALDFLHEPESSPMRQEADKLLKSAGTAGPAKVLFLRYAFGSQGLSNSVADLHEAKKITEDYAATHKHSVAWDITAGAVSFAHARLVMQMALLGIDALPRGGVLHISVAEDGPGLAVAVRAAGAKARLTQAVSDGLNGQPPEEGWNARTIQPLFAQLAAESLGGKIGAQQLTDEEIVFQVSGVRGAD